MTADVAMAKRGYGEMAITGTIAGPIFNILAGLGLGQTKTILVSGDIWGTKINFGLFEWVYADTPGGK
jgi:Ca2+/Na+ antiporter